MRVAVQSGYASRFNVRCGVEGLEMEPTRLMGRQQDHWRPLGGVSVLRPGHGRGVTHSFNRIPVGRRRPWLVTFEDYPPRAPGKRGHIVGEVLRRELLREQCLRINAMSRFALRTFCKGNDGWSGLCDDRGSPPNVFRCSSGQRPAPSTIRRCPLRYSTEFACVTTLLSATGASRRSTDQEGRQMCNRLGCQMTEHPSRRREEPFRDGSSGGH